MPQACYRFYRGYKRLAPETQKLGVRPFIPVDSCYLSMSLGQFG
jgi:hypothetical protein